MSEITRGAIGMPFEMVMESELSRRQFHSIAQALLAERDQLKAENERLESEAVYAAAGFDAAREEVARIKAENEALRYDIQVANSVLNAERRGAGQFGFAGCVICGVYTDHGGLPCPKTRAAAIALSMENQRLTPVEPLRVSRPLDAVLGNGEQS